ncbi:MAG: D-alanine-D-alanine ligase [Candidatus Amesbacteria bacterium GW2011_GWB1_47_26]|uniref:D-alanine-D-alanine ligase n=1 Tax=Candidatus Amesbacteria bacterium GW2011_GWC2_45_19 TaxID=1618366 RepID=A0A0G1M3X7_9BACT|nr:MAG: D-alanine-D-alanine ligase [Candidatus Amesbacteria bacterium GW2011_GWC2_45_19]KKU38371.1 MAG: D-alanine-D-alanine ligase [Candidatus Amesbacteria bacterium GW2011_GWA1_46_35]KKU68787.1 MAG: D-alanine-D-alanine ligase [Microgenomates group bacterium GW2011_GWC1_47_20]KKU74913.1 MAG: D-alanine-D-alanine ligase [Candidatus Amesbacteria bacterium GW2011_GWB1_47_26]KKU80086.1 MAG: D-alanine-D-alanine ligase [Candidatus Amesbacteria bacterium GW2011_GWA2_47_70]
MTPISFDYPISIAILYYDGEAEDLKDTQNAARGLEEALEEQGHMVRTLQVTEKNWRKAVKLPGQVVFNFVEDETWELYTKVGLRLEELGRAQMGHDIPCFKYVTKKARVKRRMKRLGISTPGFRIFNRRSRVSQVRGLEYPLIVKPSGQHASIGISQDSVVIDQNELQDRVKYLFKHFPGEVTAEEFIDGREIHVTVIGNGRKAVALPYCEISFGGEFKDNWDVYTYDAKWDEKSWEYWGARASAPVKMSRKLERKIERLALAAYRAFGCRDIARMDIRVDMRSRAYIVDINMNPSLNYYDTQDATVKSVEAQGWTYGEFIETLVAITYKRVYGRLPDRVRERHFLLAAPI